jgi:CHAT domain-containing protein
MRSAIWPAMAVVWLVPASAEAGEVLTTAFTRVTDVGTADGAPTVQIAWGRPDGVVLYGHGTLYAVANGLTTLGTTEVVAVDDTSATLKVTIDPAAAHPENADLAVETLVRVPDALPGDRVFELARLGIFMTDNAVAPLYSWRALLATPDVDHEQAFLPAAQLALDETAQYADELVSPDGATMARFGTLNVGAAMRAADLDDHLSFVEFVLSYPGKYIGHDWKYSETFATWVLNASPTSAAEAERRATRLAPAERDAYVASLGTLLADDAFFSQWYTDAWRAKGEKRYDDALAIADLMAAAVPYTHDPYMPSVSWAIRGDILSDIDRDDEAIAAYQKAIAVAARPGDRAVGWNNLADVYQGQHRYPDAIAAYHHAIDARSEDPTLTGKRGDALSWTGIAQCQPDAPEKAIDAWRTAIALYAGDPDPRNLADRSSALRLLGWSLRSLGRYGEANEAYLESLRIARELGWDADVASSLSAVGDGYWNLGDYATAYDHKRQAAEIRERLGLAKARALDLRDMGALAWAQGHLDDALKRYADAQAILHGLGESASEADVLDRVGDLEVERGDFAAAMEQYRAKAAIVEAGGDPATIADARWDVAYTLYAQKRYREALPEYQVASEAADRSTDRELQALLLDAWASGLLAVDDLDGAASRYERAYAIRQELGDLFGECRSQLSLVDLERKRFRFDVAREHAVSALAIAKAMPSAPLEAEAEGQLALTAADVGKFDEARQHYERELAIATTIGDADKTASAETGLGGLYLTWGRTADALAHDDRAIATAKAAGLDGTAAWGLQARAWVLTGLGRYDESEASANEALATFRAQANPWGEAAVENTLGALAHDRGDYGAAIAHYDAYRALAQANGDKWGVAAATANAAIVSADAGDFAAAIPRLEEARRIGQEIHGTEVTVVATDRLADAHAELGELDVALPLAREALAGATAGGLTAIATELHVQVGKVAVLSGDRALADAELGTALDQARAVGLPLTELAALKWQGIAAWKRGDFAAAAKALEASVALGQSVHADSRLAETWFYLARARRDSGDSEGAVTAFAAAITALEGIKATLGGGDAVNRFQADNDDIYQEYVALLESLGRHEAAFEIVGRMKASQLRQLAGTASVARSDDERAAVAEGEAIAARQRDLEKRLREELARPAKEQRPELVAEWKKGLDAIQLEFQDYTKRLGKDHPDLYDRLQVAPTGFFKIRQQLQPNEAFVEPIVLADRVVIFVVRGGDAPLAWREVKVDEAHVDALIDDMRARLSQPAAAWPVRGARVVAAAAPAAGSDDPSAPSRELYDLVIRPIRDDLVGVDTLIVSPSGRLRYVPFAALTDGDRYLVEDYRIALLTGTGALADHDAMPKKAPMLAFGNPDGSLPGAEAEVTALEKTWKKRGIDAFVGDAATKQALEDGVADARVLHLATHGILLAEDPEGSYILLAGHGDDARLTFQEIPLLPLDHVDLVVLSACETAVGEHGQGAEIAGLAYQFEMRGAATVVASLWAVEDKSTSRLMQGLYANLSAGQSKAEALRQAQLALLADPATAHPFYWAPFIAIGDWR